MTAFTAAAPRQLAVLSPVAQLHAGRMPRRLLQLYVGLVLFGVSMALQVRSALGLDPWDVLHAGLAAHLGLSFGTVVIVVGFLVLLLWIPLRQMPGLGTVSNAVVVGLASDLTLGVLSTPHSPLLRWGLLIGGIVLNGFADALYIGSQLGPGPRDGLMTGLVRRTGRSFRVVRTAIEATVLVVGWLLGGTVGVGTVLYAVAIGPLVNLMLPRLIVDLPRVSALGGQQHRGVRGHHDLGGGEPGVGQPLLAEDVHTTLVDRRP